MDRSREVRLLKDRLRLVSKVLVVSDIDDMLFWDRFNVVRLVLEERSSF